MFCGKPPGFPTKETIFKVKHRMECEWVKAKVPLENPGSLAENPLKIPRKIFPFAVGHTLKGLATPTPIYTASTSKTIEKTVL